MKSTANNIKKIPASDDAERGRNLIDNADNVRHFDEFVYQPRVINAGISGHESTTSRT